ncbi:MAG: hypothetical protein WD926_01650 [Patescibacteria group bacterium]
MDWDEATASAGWDPRLGFAAAAFDGKLWVMGGVGAGVGADAFRNDVWHSEDGVTWTEATAAADWAVRNVPRAVVFADKLWLLGGFVPGTGYVNDVWHSEDGVTWTEATAAADWAGRESFGVAVLDGKLWVMGGWAGAANFNDVWYSEDGVTWTEATAAASWPARRDFGFLVFDDKLWVMGGQAAAGRVNDVWYSEDGVTWTEATAAAAWSGRRGHDAIVFDDKHWVMGGLDSGGARLNDVWYSEDGVTWTEATAAADWTARNSFRAAAFSNKLWIMGGSSGSHENDVWSTPNNSISHYVVCWGLTPGSCTYTATTSTNSFTHTDPLAFGTWYLTVQAVTFAGESSAVSEPGSVEVEESIARKSIAQDIVPRLPDSGAGTLPLAAATAAGYAAYRGVRRARRKQMLNY